jgi:phosphoribosylaminoimidazole carboxylase (NCAIR synthetase)
MKDLGLTVESSPKQIQQATDAFGDLQDRFKTTQRLLKLGIPLPVDAPIEAAKQVANALERLKNNASTRRSAICGPTSG